MYFSNIPLITYGSSLSNVRLAKNILQSAKFTDFFKSDEQLFVDYKIKDGEKPEHIANRVYGSPELHWIILLFNDILNPYFEWPLEQSELENQILTTYPGSSIFVSLTPEFTETNGLTILPKYSNFIVGENISHEDGLWEATIKSWDPTLRKVEIDSITGSFNPNISSTYSGNVISINSQDKEFYAPISRVVFDNTYALHHFEDSDGNFIDPYNDYIGTNISSTSLTNSAFESDFLLKQYLNSTDEGDLYAIVNRRYEEVVNDNKRNIQLLKLEYLSYAIDTFNKIFK